MAAYDRRHADLDAPYTGEEVDRLLDLRINDHRPSADPWTPEAARARGGLPNHVNGGWTFDRDGVAVLVLRCPRCSFRYTVSEPDMRRLVAEATRRDEDVWLTL